MEEKNKTDNEAKEVQLGDNEDFIFSGYDIKPHSER